MTLALNRRKTSIAGELDAKLDISHYLFLLFWVMKPLYFGPSGTMQISDFIFVLSVIAWIICHRGNIPLDKKDLPLLAFVFATLIINGIYTALHANTGFVMSTAYYVYNFAVVVLMRDFIKNKLFLKALLWASAFNLMLELAVLFLGTGRYAWGIYRFMGTFNDPNQFSFSMFTSFLIVYLLSSYFKDLEESRKKAVVLFVFVLAFFFIFKGSSTGMLLGIVTFSLLFALTFINSERTALFTLLKTLAIILLAVIVVYILLTGLSPGDINGSVESDSFLIVRLFSKANKVDGGGFMALIDERGIDKLFTNPLFLFFGAGEGGYWRFPGSEFEIHSTLLGILFYYGILPFILLMSWFKNNLKSVSRMAIPVYLALLFESFTLANQRQPALWVILVLGSLEYANAQELRKYRIVVKL